MFRELLTPEHGTSMFFSFLFLTSEEGSDMSSGNVGKKLPLLTA